MPNFIFFSWQSDRPNNVCRSFVHRALEDAIQRLKADVEVEESLREALEIDSDTKNVPGSPEIFKTILSKISDAGAFVADLTFVSEPDSDHPVSNPNVLIEYGYALNAPGELRMIAVMNSAFGEPTPATMPFNLRHKRFPITYMLQDGASPQERKAARKALTDLLEKALKMVFNSAEFNASGKAERRPTAFETAASLAAERKRQRQLANLRGEEGIGRTRDLARALIMAIESKCERIESANRLGIRFGAIHGEHDGSPWLAARVSNSLGLHINWQEPGLNSGDEVKLVVGEYQGWLTLPGERQPMPYQPPREQGRILYQPTLSPQEELGWEKLGHGEEEPFLSTDDLADHFVTRLLQLLPH